MKTLLQNLALAFAFLLVWVFTLVVLYGMKCDFRAEDIHACRQALDRCAKWKSDLEQ